VAAGLTESRNAGVARATGDLVLFLDDDVELTPTYVQEVIAAFDTPCDRRVGGVGGAARNRKPLTWWRRLRWLLDLVFLNSGFREGRVLLSGFCSAFGATPFPPRAVTRVDFLVGYAFSFRREVFDDYLFTPGFHGRASGEDQDFCLQVARDYALILTPEAVLDHHESPEMRPARRVMVRRYLIGRYLIFRDRICRGWYHWPLFWYAVSGYLLTQCGASLLSRNRDDRGRFKGALSALADIVAGRVPERHR
jgi:GT2 family glycosyltransferase